jgi:hypothetical protein
MKPLCRKIEDELEHALAELQILRDQVCVSVCVSVCVCVSMCVCEHVCVRVRFSQRYADVLTKLQVPCHLTLLD